MKNVTEFSDVLVVLFIIKSVYTLMNHSTGNISPLLSFVVCSTGGSKMDV